LQVLGEMGMNQAGFQGFPGFKGGWVVRIFASSRINHENVFPATSDETNRTHYHMCLQVAATRATVTNDNFNKAL